MGSKASKNCCSLIRNMIQMDQESVQDEIITFESSNKYTDECYSQKKDKEIIKDQLHETQVEKASLLNSDAAEIDKWIMVLQEQKVKNAFLEEKVHHLQHENANLRIEIEKQETKSKYLAEKLYGIQVAVDRQMNICEQILMENNN